MSSNVHLSGLVLVSLAFQIPAAGEQPGAEADRSDRVDYTTAIKPIFADHCAHCHGADEQQSGLRLDAAAFAIQGGDRGPAVLPRNSRESRLYLAITDGGDIPAMPADDDPLDPQKIALIKRWIDEGAQAPQDEAAEVQRRDSDHWAFQPVTRPAVPDVDDPAWIRNPIDAFVLARLDMEGLRPSPPADRATLVRRVSLDLRGLLPSIREVEQFLKDDRAGAYVRLVERMLASPHYGERWGRHWLDVARYADSNGFTIDSARAIWKYRDWVIHAINDDMPFDQFTIEQLAGDLLPDATTQQLVATGFHRNTLINEEGGTDDEQFRVEAIVDRVDTTGTAFLGLTVGCARCHAHKYDPITQREYYELFAVFDNCDEPRLRLPSPEQKSSLERLDVRIADVEARVRELEAEHAAQGAAEQQPAEDPPSTEQEDPLKKEFAQLKKQREKLLSNIPTTLILRERNKPRDTHIHIRGDFLRKGARVSAGVPDVLPPWTAGDKTPARLKLARWLVDTSNPLTARVIVNRIWQRFFGRGLVATENDFGTQGAPPSHPELLDWLADEFVRREWSIKSLQRLIVASATYRQSSHVSEALRQRDPRNGLLARQARLRLEAEIIRDVSLEASGLLIRRIGGPSVFPPQPEGIYVLTQQVKDWPVDKGPNRYRRGMYTFFWRSSPDPFLATFDAPDATTTCTRRARSNTPLQALTLANDRAFFELAAGLARRLLAEAPKNDRGRIEFLFLTCLSRRPSDREASRLADFLREQRIVFESAAEEAHHAAALVGSSDVNSGVNDKQRAAAIESTPAASLRSTDQNAEAAAWVALARVMLNLDEFITRE